MGVAANMKMVNGRVSSRAAEKAARVLAGEGLTISSFIRNSVEHVALTGEVPESGFPAKGNAPDRSRLRELLQRAEALPMPGKDEHPGLSGDALAERLLMERHGY